MQDCWQFLCGEILPECLIVKKATLFILIPTAYLQLHTRMRILLTPQEDQHSVSLFMLRVNSNVKIIGCVSENVLYSLAQV